MPVANCLIKPRVYFQSKKKKTICLFLDDLFNRMQKTIIAMQNLVVSSSVQLYAKLYSAFVS